MVNGEGGILLPFQCSLDSPRLFQRCYLFFCYYRKFRSETLCRCCVTAEMLGEARVQINARSARGESRTPDQGLMSPLLYH
jgi:hypothetical protein